MMTTMFTCNALQLALADSTARWSDTCTECEVTQGDNAGAWHLMLDQANAVPVGVKLRSPMAV